MWPNMLWTEEDLKSSRSAVSGTTHGWVLAYIVVPLLLELFKSSSVKSMLGHIHKVVMD